MLLGVWWVLILVLKDECDAVLKDKLRTNKDNVNAECEYSCPALSEVVLDGLLSCSEVREGVTKFILLVLGGAVVLFRLDV